MNTSYNNKQAVHQVKRALSAVGVSCHNAAAILCFLFLASCSNDDYLGGHVDDSGAGVPVSITAQIAGDAVNGGQTKFNEGDMIAISTGYAQADATNRNRAFVADATGTTFEPSAGYPFYLKGISHLVAYYPFSGSEGAEPTLHLSVAEGSPTPCYVAVSDTLVVSGDKLDVNLQFHYAYGQLSVKFNAPSGEKIKSFRLLGFALEGDIDPYTGGVTTQIPADLARELTAEELSSQTINLTMVPQTIDATASIPAEIVLIGQQRSYTVSLSEASVTAGAVTAVSIDVTTGATTYEFITDGAAWNDNGKGGNVFSE